MQITWLKLFIYSLIPLSDLYLRIFKLNSSIDRIWTLFPLFQLPIFNLIPLVMMKFNYIKRGKMRSYPFDMFIITYFIIRHLSNIQAENHNVSSGCIYDFPYAFLIEFLGFFFAIIFPFLIRIFPPKKEQWECPHKFGYHYIKKIIGQGGIIFLVIMAMMFMVPRLSTFRALLGDTLTSFIIYVPCYLLTNMYNGNKKKNFCTNKKSSNKILIAGVISILIGSRILYYYKYKLPGPLTYSSSSSYYDEY